MNWAVTSLWLEWVCDGDDPLDGCFYKLNAGLWYPPGRGGVPYLRLPVNTPKYQVAGTARGAKRKQDGKLIVWCTSEQQLADALTKSMVVWGLINMLKRKLVTIKICTTCYTTRNM